MCGIAGFIVEDERAPVESRAALLDQMCRVITHRGPDDQGALVKGRAAIGMRRLSIIDLAGGHQPIFNEDGSIAIVFNGEIYNYRELRSALESSGHAFKTNSDTEAIVHAYEEYGEDCPNHLRGMFAFAIWDENERKLFIARDRVGKKPLYYSRAKSGALLFGSELKSLLVHPEFEREINYEALDAYLSFGYVPDPLCIFKNAQKLPPGCHLTFQRGVVSVKQYWDFQYERTEKKKEKDYLEELRVLIDEAVRVRLVSDVPLGAFLSGGIDSSAIVAYMARNMDQPVKTFSIGFNEDSYNELKYARITAKHFGTDHHEFIVTPDICKIVDELAWHFDEPFADSSALPTYMVSKMARDFVTVVLSGDGGDELFAGYTRYVVDKKRSGLDKVPRVVREKLMQPLSAALPHRAWGKNYIRNVSLEPLDRYIDSLSLFTELNKRSLYTQDFRERLNGNCFSIGQELFRSRAESVNTGNSVDPLLYLDSKTYLPGDILTKVDRMSMAVSLEARVPLLDHKLIEFVTRIPASLKLKRFETKHIFKRAVRGLVPDEILDRPKQGFGVPIQEWINQQLRSRIHETLTDRRATNRGLFESSYIDILLDEHERGRRDHSASLWALFMLEMWYHKFVDAKERV
jgi:asparagine synthase (glutamine-hydrolysing)